MHLGVPIQRVRAESDVRGLGDGGACDPEWLGPLCRRDLGKQDEREVTWDVLGCRRTPKQVSEWG